MNIDDAAMKSVVAKAILDSLTPESREALITSAVKSLLDERAGSGYNSPSVIQAAFNSAVRDVAGQVARDMLKDDEGLKAKIRKLMLDAWEKLAGGEAYEKLIEKVSNAFEKGITGDRY